MNAAALGVSRIRAAVAGDVEALVLLGAQMHDESPQWRRFGYAPGRVRGFFESLIADANSALFVAQRGPQLVGGIAGNVGPHWSSHDYLGHEIALFIVPEQRGTTLAARLVRTFEEWAFGRGCKAIHVGSTTGVDDEMVASLYERLGFRRAGIVLEKFYAD